MRVKIGDRVRFLNEVGEGIVKKLQDRGMVEVETTDGWTIPYLASDLIVIPDDPNEAPFKPVNELSTAQPASQPKSVSAENESKNCFLAIARNTNKEDGFTGIRLYLINDTSLPLVFCYYSEDHDQHKLVEHDTLEAGTKIFLDELSIEQLSSCQGFSVRGVFVGEHEKGLPPLVSKSLPFQIKKYHSAGAYIENDYFHEPVILFNLIENDRNDYVPVKDLNPDEAQIENKSNSRRQKSKDQPREIDLHINQLVDSVVGMSNREILRVQIGKFEEELNKAIESKEREIVFIHGIGNGTLKEALRKAIEDSYPVCTYEDASFKDYGFGATLVLIRQNR